MATNTEVGVKITVDGSDAVQSVGSIKKQLREATADLIAMRQKFGDTSKEAVEAAKRVANLKDEIGDAKAFTDAFNPDAKFKAFGAALQGVAGGFAAVQGAQALFGSESKELEKTLVKVQGAMALSQGLNSVLEARDSFKNLATFVKGGLSNAFGSLRQAIISTGIGALVVAVGLLIANFDKVKKVVLNFVPGLAAVGDTIMGIVNAVTDFLGVTSEAQRQTDKLISDTEKRIKQTETFLETNADKYDEYTQRKIKANLEYNKKLVEVNKNEEMSEAEKQALLKQYRDKADREIKKAGDDRQKAADEVSKKEKEKEDQKNKEFAEKRKKAQEERIASDKEAAKQLRDLQQQNELAAIEDERKRAERKLQLDFENQKKELEQTKFTAEQKRLILLELENRLRLDLDAIAAEEAAKQEEKAIKDAEISAEKSNERRKREFEQQQQRTEDEKKAAEERIKVAEAERQAKADLANQTADIAIGLAGLLRSVNEKSKGVAIASLIIEQAAAVAKIITSTQLANAGALATPQAIATSGAAAAPVILRNNIMAGISIATAIASVVKGINQIKSASSSGSGGGGGSAPSGGGMSAVPTAPLAPQAQTTLINQGQVNQIGNVAARAYVVESDVSGNQQRIQRLERAARIA
jgi:hypothetical protein